MAFVAVAVVVTIFIIITLGILGTVLRHLTFTRFLL